MSLLSDAAHRCHCTERLQAAAEFPQHTATGVPSRQRLLLGGRGCPAACRRSCGTPSPSALHSCKTCAAPVGACINLPACTSSCTAALHPRAVQSHHLCITCRPRTKTNSLRLHALTTACRAALVSLLVAAPCSSRAALCACVLSPPVCPARLVPLPTMLVTLSSAFLCGAHLLAPCRPGVPADDLDGGGERLWGGPLRLCGAAGQGVVGPGQCDCLRGHAGSQL